MNPDHSDGSTLVMEPTGAFAELSKIILGAQPLTAVLQRVAELARQTIPGAADVSVTLIEGQRARSVVFTGELAIDLDERQYDNGFGPCMDAATTGRTVTIDDTANDAVYPDFSRQALRCGVLNTLSVGLPVRQRTIGALNIYGKDPDPFDDVAKELAHTFAGYGAVAVANAALYASTAELAAQMQQAMTSRAVIDQAKGILMAENRCSADDAFALLAKESQRLNRKLRDVAAEIVKAVPEGRRAASGNTDHQYNHYNNRILRR